MEHTRKRTIRSDFTFHFDTPLMMSFDDFIKNEDSKKTRQVLSVKFQDIFMAEETDELIFPRFELQGVFVEFSQAWFNQVKISITKKDFLYMYYHFIFGVKLYTYISVQSKKGEKDIGHFSIINEYALKDIQKDLIESRPVYPIPSPRLKRRVGEDSYQAHLKIGQGWEGMNTDIFETKNEDDSLTKIFITPIRVWTEEKNAIEQLKKILKKLGPNTEYDKKEEDNGKELLRTGEIFEYFAAISKREKTPSSFDRIRERLFEEAEILGISDEAIQEQMNMVEDFLANIIK